MNAVSNFVGIEKLKFNYVSVIIFVEKVHKIDSGEIETSSSALNIEGRSIRNNINSNRNRDISQSRNNRSNSKSSRNLECWKCGGQEHMNKNCMAPKKDKSKGNATNMTTNEIQEAFFFYLNSL